MPSKRTSPAGYKQGRVLRKHQTPAEAKPWARLRDGRLQGVVFRRQHAIGPYVTDFCAPHHHLVIELDGSVHLQQEKQDDARTEYLAAQGYRVLRFWNNDALKKMDAVASVILDALRLGGPPPASHGEEPPDLAVLRSNERAEFLAGLDLYAHLGEVAQPVGVLGSHPRQLTLGKVQSMVEAGRMARGVPHGVLMRMGAVSPDEFG